MTFFKDLAEFQFLQYAVIASILCAIVCGSVGTFVVIRRSTYVAGAVAHSALGGIGFARYMQVVHNWQWFSPMTGAILTALITALFISFSRKNLKEREDTILSVIWAMGMAIGLTFMSLTPGYTQDLMGYLFGDLLLVSKIDLAVITIFTVLLISFIAWTFDRLVAVSFNAQLAELRGQKPLVLETLFTIATAITIVVLVRVVGIVLVIALLTLPAATACRLTRNVVSIVLWAIGISLFTLMSGLWLSYECNLPTGATIIEVSGVLFLLTWVIKK